jgi:protocatechuate 3,4-dioxygenase beta subunit
MPYSILGKVPRRLSLASAGISILGVARPFDAWAGLPATPAQTPGPWYPQSLPLDVDNDLVRIDGQNRNATGDVTHIYGRVMDTNGMPVQQAKVEIWQVDNNGRYHHVADGRSSLGELDPYFQGYGITTTASDGGYRFRTIKPVAYSRRSPHIHFAVTLPNSKFITQMYLAGDPLNDRDPVLSKITSLQERALVMVDLRPTPSLESGALGGNFDLVLGV